MIPTQHRRSWRARLSGEPGQTTMEWMAIMAVIVGIVLAVMAASSDLGRMVDGTMNRLVCQATGGDCGGAGGGVGTAAPDIARVEGPEAADARSGEAGEADGGGAAGPETGVGSGGGGGGGGSDGGGGGGGILDRIGDAASSVGGAIVDGGGALIGGFVLGDAGEPHSNPVLEGLRQVGHIGSGILVVGDIRDGGLAINRIATTGEGWGDLGLSVIGLVPVLGDVAKGAKGVDAVGDAVRAADDVADAADTAVDAGRAADDVAGGTRPGRIADDALSPEELAQRNADRARRGSSNSRDAAILEDNMATIDGITKPPGHEAHHIVPPRHRSGERVREILDDLDVPYNHEANGVHLPGPHIDPGDASPHRRVHTNRYYEELEDRLSHATTAEEAQEILRQVGQELSDGTFPY